MERDPTDQELLRVAVSLTMYRLVWIGLMVIQIVTIGMLFIAGAMYAFLASPNGETTRKQLDLMDANGTIVIALMTFVCMLLYVWSISQYIGESWRTGQLRFPHSKIFRVGGTQDRPVRRGSWYWTIRLVYASLFCRRGLFGLDHPAFPVLLFVRELIELIPLTYQCYVASFDLANPHLQSTLAMVLFFNCCSTPLVCLLWSRCSASKTPSVAQVATLRAWCLAVDALLDAVWTIGIPVVVILKYVAVYRFDRRGFADEQLADHKWYLVWTMEVRYLCVTSGMDLFAFLVPLLSILIAVRGIGELLCLSEDTTAKAIQATPYRRHSSSSSAATVMPMPQPPPLRRGLSRQLSRLVSRVGLEVTLETFDRWTTIVLALCGVVVMVAHVQARNQSTDPTSAMGCELWAYPWGRTDPQCVLANIRCVDHTRNMTIGEQLVRLEPESLQSLIISHCAALEMPLEITRLRALRMLEVYNSTIVTWSADAAITSQRHPFLQSIGLVRVQLGAIPDGLLQDVPASVINLVATNLTTLPPSIPAEWVHVKYLSIEHGALSEFPMVLTAMPGLEWLSLSHNNLTEMPRLPSSLRSLLVQRNPVLRALPDLTQWSALTWISMDETMIDSFPRWLTANELQMPGLVVYAQRAPICTSRDRPRSQVLVCDQQDPRQDGLYPLYAIDRRLQLSGR